MFKIRRADVEDPAERTLLRQLHLSGYSQLRAVQIESVLRGEGISVSDFALLMPLFANPVIESVGYESFFAPIGPIIEISYKRAVTDPELDSIRHGADCLGVDSLTWARLSTRYQFIGINEATAAEIAERYLFNKQVQTIVTGEWSTLVPQGETGEVENIDLGKMHPDQLAELSDKRRLFLSGDQMLASREFFTLEEKRPARDAEIEMLAAAWSDHCSHTTWRALGLLDELKKATRRIQHPLVVSAYSDNSGVMAFYGGWAINVKGETHISPTFAGSPYGGIMTKHGGVIRDIIFTGLGAYPIAGTTIMATCDPRIPWEEVPAGAFHPLTVLKESIRGTHDYTNPMGIPMAWSQYLVDPRNWKGLALGHSIGILPESQAQQGEPLPGDFVVLIGGPTGIDGIHGATVSSGSMTSETVARDSAHVQIGMPIEERKFMEAIPVLRNNDCIRACTDCGAAGLSSAVGEMGSACGVWVNLAWVPLKCAGMKLWEIWLSESQERGVLAVPPDKLSEAVDILDSYGVPASVIGVFTRTGRCQVVHDPGIKFGGWIVNPLDLISGTIAIDLPYSFLTAGCPLPKVAVSKPARAFTGFSPSIPQNASRWIDLVEGVLGHYNICDQSAAAHQFDQTVQGTTVSTYVSGPGERMPDELFVTAPVFGKPWGVGIANAVNQFYGDVDPATFGRLMLASAAAKLVAAGFAPFDINFCANVYSPPVTDDPEQAWRLEQLVRHGYAPGTVEIGMPVTSGKDSSSGRFKNHQTGEKIDAPFTLDILAVGRMPDAHKLIPKPFCEPGDLIYLHRLGTKFELGGSVLYDLFGQRGDVLPSVDLVALRQGFEDYHAGVGRVARSRSAIAEGGLIRRLFECCFGSGLGCTINLNTVKSLEWLFGEIHGAILYTVTPLDVVLYRLPAEDLIGIVTGDPGITVYNFGKVLFSRSVRELAKSWSKTFTEVIS